MKFCPVGRECAHSLAQLVSLSSVGFHPPREVGGVSRQVRSTGHGFIIRIYQILLEGVSVCGAMRLFTEL